MLVLRANDLNPGERRFGLERDGEADAAIGERNDGELTARLQNHQLFAVDDLAAAAAGDLLRDFGLGRRAALPERLARKRIDADDLAAALEGDAAGRDRTGTEVELAGGVVTDVAIAEQRIAAADGW